MKYLPSAAIQIELLKVGLEQFAQGVELDDQELSAKIKEFRAHPIHAGETEQELLDRAAYFLIWRDHGVPEVGKAAEDVTAKRITVMHESLREMVREHFPKMAGDFADVKASASVQANSAKMLNAQFGKFIDQHHLENLRLRGDFRALHNAIVSGQVEAITTAQGETDKLCKVIGNFGKMVFWGLLAIISILAALTFFAAHAHAQIDVIQFQDNAGANVATYAAPFKFKAGSNCSASKSGSTVTFNCAGGAAAAGGSNTQVQYNNATALGGITNMTSDGTNITKLTAGAGPFDLSNATIVKLRIAAGLTTSANGDCGYDTTNNRWHCWQGGVDRLMIASTNIGAAGQVAMSNADGSETFADPITSGNQAAATAQTITATGAKAAVTVTNIGQVLVTVSGTYAGVAFNFEASPDGTFTPAFPVQATQVDAAAIGTATGALSSNATRSWFVDVAGFTQFRVNATAFTSGTANITITPIYFQYTPLTSAQIVGTPGVNLSQYTPVTGRLPVDGSGVTQPVSGTVTTTPPANASTNVAQVGGTNVSTGTGAGGAGIPRVTVSNDSTVGLVAGTSIVGKFTTDQTTHGTTDLVADDITKVGGAAVSLGQKAMASAIPVVVASDQSPISAYVRQIPLLSYSSFTLADTNSVLWQTTMLDTGVLQTSQISSGTAALLYFDDIATQSTWQITVTTGGVLQATSVSFNPVYPSAIGFVTKTGLQSALIMNSGVFVALQPTASSSQNVNLAAVGGSPITARAVPPNGSEYGLVVRDPSTSALLNMLSTQASLKTVNARLTASFNRGVTSTADALDVNIKYPPASADPCTGRKTNIAISQTANAQLVTGAVGRIWVCSIFIVGADAENVSLVEGSGTTCGTGTAAVIGGTTAANGPNMAANGGFIEGNGGASVTSSATPGNSLCLFQSGSGRVAGNLTFAYAP